MKCYSCGVKGGLDTFKTTSSKLCLKCLSRTEKRCPDCDQMKPIEEFKYKSSDKEYGYCRSCRNIRNKAYEDKRANTDERRLATLKSSRRRNNAEAARRWREANPDYAERAKAYREANRDKLLIGRSNARCAKNGYDGSVSVSQWRFVLELYDDKCASDPDHVIDKNNGITVDHVVPLKDGGRNCVHNIQPLCLRCNMKKGKREVDFRTEDVSKAIYEEYPECSMGSGRTRCRSAFEIRNKVLIGDPNWSEDS